MDHCWQVVVMVFVGPDYNFVGSLVAEFDMHSFGADIVVVAVVDMDIGTDADIEMDVLVDIATDIAADIAADIVVDIAVDIVVYIVDNMDYMEAYTFDYMEKDTDLSCCAINRL